MVNIFMFTLCFCIAVSVGDTGWKIDGTRIDGMAYILDRGLHLHTQHLLMRNELILLLHFILSLVGVRWYGS